MNCKKVQKRLHEYMTGEIISGERQKMDFHLADCQLCQRELESLHSLWNILETWEEADPPEELLSQTLNRIKTDVPGAEKIPVLLTTRRKRQ